MPEVRKWQLASLAAAQQQFMYVRGGIAPSNVYLQGIASKTGKLTVASMYKGMAGLGLRGDIAERLVVLTHKGS